MENEENFASVVREADREPWGGLFIYFTFFVRVKLCEGIIMASTRHSERARTLKKKLLPIIISFWVIKCNYYAIIYGAK